MEITSFDDYLGQDHIKSYFQDAVKNERAGHAYIICGPRGSGKKTIAGLFAAALLCEGEGDKPCISCHSCRMSVSENNPDIKIITHEKPSTISVKEVRAQLVSDIHIKPYYGRKKIYIVPDSHLMRSEGQNALLKSIEEPPEYVTILLLTENEDALLPTVRSRCVTFYIQPLADATIQSYLMKKKGLSERDAAVCASFAGGNLGSAIEFSESEHFREDLAMTLDFLKNSRELEIKDVFSFAKDLSARKSDLENILDIILLMYHDILVFKAAGKKASLTFIDESGYIETKAQQTSYEELNRVINTIDELKGRLKYNANTEASLDVLMLNVAR